MTESYNGLIVIAHPDDESLFAGGILFRTQHTVCWHVICMTNESDTRRADEFRRVIIKLSGRMCLGITGEMFDVPDGYASETTEDDPRMKRFLATVNKKLETSDVLISHGKTGEYGHDDHKAVYQLCRKMVALRSSELAWLTFQPLSRTTAGGHQLGRAEVDFKRALLGVYTSQTKVFKLAQIIPYVTAEKLGVPDGRTNSSDWLEFVCPSGLSSRVQSMCMSGDGETFTVCWSGSFSCRLRRHQLAGISSDFIALATDHPGCRVWMNVSHVRSDDGEVKWTFWFVARDRPEKVRVAIDNIHGPIGFISKIMQARQDVGRRFEIGGNRGETEGALSTGVDHHDTALVSTTTTTIDLFHQEVSAFCAVNAVQNLVDLGGWYERLRDLGGAASMGDIMFILNRESGTPTQIHPVKCERHMIIERIRDMGRNDSCLVILRVLSRHYVSWDSDTQTLCDTDPACSPIIGCSFEHAYSRLDVGTPDQMFLLVKRSTKKRRRQEALC
jgi:LmbE family N-acetylglucosaminyl deacetylase